MEGLTLGLIDMCTTLADNLRDAAPDLSFAIAVSKDDGTSRLWTQNAGAASSSQLVAHLASVFLLREVGDDEDNEEYVLKSREVECRICSHRSSALCEGRTIDLECSNCGNMSADPIEESNA